MDENPIKQNPTGDIQKTTGTEEKNIVNLNNFSLNPKISIIKKIEPIKLNIENIEPQDKKGILNFSILNFSKLNIFKKKEIKITNNESDIRATELLASEGNGKYEKKLTTNTFQRDVIITLVGYAIAFLGVLGILGTQTYKKYITIENQIQIAEEDLDFSEKGKKVELFLTKYLKINNYAEQINQTNQLINDAVKENFVNSIKADKKLTYTQKRNIVQKNLDGLIQTTSENNAALKDIKDEIEKYGFIPRELYEMTQKEEGIEKIRRSLVLREDIRFMTALKVFGYMQSFIQGFANDSNIDAVEAENKIRQLNSDGEKDIIIYTNNCYFNPYEIGDDCAITNEFDNYYTIIEKESKSDPLFIKKITSYTERKLKEAEIPNFTITFPGFNPKDDSISFSTEINTNRQDELALNKVGIINPHLHIITNLINTLKQSLLVIGESIKVDQIKITPKTIKVGSTIFNVNTSTLRFQLPIQKADEREISDFFNSQP